MPNSKKVSKTFSINFDDDEYKKMEYVMKHLNIKKKTDVFRYLLQYTYRACKKGDIEKQ